MKIAFWDNYLCERGTTTALYDYAYYNKYLLGNESIILYDKTNKNNLPEIIKMFENEFDFVYGANGFDDAKEVITQQKCDVLYIIKYGTNDGKVANNCKTVAHGVFVCTEPHGDVYCTVAPNLPGYNPNIPILPHMINLPDTDENMRLELGIPEDAVVFGRYGGPGEFDDLDVQKILYKFLQDHPNIYAIFANTNRFCNDLPNLIHLPRIIDRKEKVRFINTCDAMLWARYRGETFGLSIAEFSSRNKPVFCKRGYDENRHMELLGDKAVVYNYDNLYSMLETFNREEARTKDWNAYRDYEPSKVMEIFERLINH